mgnify:FL=1|tara:strand:- start:400 stop:552 length:153 start_codon:yes stop_codon:yes gene_type:complete
MRKLRFIKGDLKLRFRVIKNIFLFRNGYENVLKEFLIEVSSLGLIGFKIK